jgi:hypothetical protein
MGVVLRAWERALDRPVALKLLLPQTAAGRADARARFLREARAAAGLHHPRVVPVFAVGEAGGTPYLAMPLLRGRSLGAHLKERGRLPVAEALRLAREAVEGLAAAHARGLTHRDVKPDNVWLEDGDGGPHVRLLDFGLARGGAAEAITVAGRGAGTPYYMAPEQADGAAPDPRADLFSLGCVLYEMLAGRRAFAGPTLSAVLRAVATATPPPLSALDPPPPPGPGGPGGRPARQGPGPADRLGGRGRRGDPGAGNRRGRGGDGPTGPAEDPANFAPAPSGPPMAAAVAPATSTPAPSVPVKVASFAVHHYEKVGANDALDRGLIGGQSFGARRGDQVTVEVRLSRPAYAQLVVFWPDGVLDAVAPRPPGLPVKGDLLRYPPAGEPGVRYGLDEGAGLWVFAVVVSDAPLPAFDAWAEARPAGWGRRPAAPGTVLAFDGEWVDTVTASGATRGAGSAALGIAAPVAWAAETLKRKTGAALVVARAFAVGESK